jgi:PAS domain S-box-containing protein/diguanylate cyclase (GGDEF)-like protein
VPADQAFHLSAREHCNYRVESLDPKQPILQPISRFRLPRRKIFPDDIWSNLMAGAPEGILVADIRQADAPIIYVNSAFETITGYAREEVIGKNCRYLQGSDRLQPQIGTLRAALAAGSATQVRLRNYRKNGTMFWNDLHLVPIHGPAAAPTYYAGFIRDVTEQVATAGRLEEMLHTDRLTGCLNRDALVEQLSARAKSSQMLLIKLDIARFHEINGGYGYDVGDALLRATAERLQTFGADLVVRLGSDQFALAFENPGNVAEVLERLSRCLAARFTLPDADLIIRFAIGFATGAPGADARTLARQAGAALADSKASLLRRPCEFAVERETTAHQRLQMASELQRALAADAFIYHYQPQVDLPSGKIIGAEALIRWQHPLFGLQPPSRFIGLTEETGLILDIGAAGLREVAQFIANFNRPRSRPLGFSFNVSSIELTHQEMASLVRRVIDETGIEPAWLTLELTESLLAEDSPEMLGIFRQLRELGIGLSIDDFGTGHSSLRYLERFPLTEIKIDRSFVAGLPFSAAKRVIVEAVIKLGAELDVRVIAEGVEQQNERDMLAAMGCRIAQGNLFNPPVTADLFKVAEATDCNE